MPLDILEEEKAKLFDQYYADLGKMTRKLLDDLGETFKSTHANTTYHVTFADFKTIYAMQTQYAMYTCEKIGLAAVEAGLKEEVVNKELEIVGLVASELGYKMATEEHAKQKAEQSKTKQTPC